MLDRLQAMVCEPLQRGGDLVMSSILYTWRNQAVRRVSKAEGVINQITSAITTEDWSLQHCQDYLVELEMVTSGALMALRLTANDIGSDQVSVQAEGRVHRVSGPKGSEHGLGVETEAPGCKAAGQR